MFAGHNDQFRRFTDFHAFESQNWFMLSGRRAAGRGTLSATGMISAERLTLKRLGSHQVFQTGETFGGGPLIDYQHPHDVLMQLGLRYDRPMGSGRGYVAAAIVGEPAMGPPVFMHRPSAAFNPQVPLAHHFMDATHITPGVVSAGVFRGGAGLEASWFRGREPDENRWDVDAGRLDSWALRGSWGRGPWHVQMSGARLTAPEALEPFDVTRLSASVTYARDAGTRPFAMTLAWGQNREFYGRSSAWLAEAAWELRPRLQLYARGELVMKNILTAGGLHPPGFTHPHILSRVGALTTGGVRDVVVRGRLRVGLGGDLTVYRVPANLVDSYGAPWSTHLFVRLAFDTAGHRH